MAQLVQDVMTPNPVALEATASLVEAALAMRDFDVGAVLVLENGQVRGIVTDRDIVVRGIAGGNYPATVTLGEICSRELTTLSPTDSVEEAVAQMRDKCVRRLPVVEHGHPVGIVSLGDLAIEKDPHSALGDISAAPPNR
ncbi:MAG: CBS domain-containing protein [Candidatus Tectomicrobia bacterium]|nr:CBS domain-containing protein [Candidatus Tectomicrobia bacterium]